MGQITYNYYPNWIYGIVKGFSNISWNEKRGMLLALRLDTPLRTLECASKTSSLLGKTSITIKLYALSRNKSSRAEKLLKSQEPFSQF